MDPKELHPDVCYEDPEENDWQIPILPNPSQLPDNTSSWGPFYLWQGRARGRQWPVSVAVTHEISPPWRRGLGVVWRLRRGRCRALGLWLPGQAPLSLLGAPREENWQDVVAKHNQLRVISLNDDTRHSVEEDNRGAT
jgi:hypothetical protein